MNCLDKAKQYKLVANSSVLPPLNFLTTKRIDHIYIQDGEILPLIRNLKSNKATGSDGISGHMLLLCDDSVVLPLKLIFQNILTTSTYLLFSLLPICGKIFEKIIFNKLYSYLSVNNLITKNQSGFRPGDSTTNQLLFLSTEIHEAFDNPNSLEVPAVFRDISKAFDKVSHECLIFNLKINGISGSLSNLFENYLQS